MKSPVAPSDLASMVEQQAKKIMAAYAVKLAAYLNETGGNVKISMDFDIELCDDTELVSIPDCSVELGTCGLTEEEVREDWAQEVFPTSYEIFRPDLN